MMPCVVIRIGSGGRLIVYSYGQVPVLGIQFSRYASIFGCVFFLWRLGNYIFIKLHYGYSYYITQSFGSHVCHELR